MPKRIQLSRAKGWRLPPNTVKVDRTTRFGNPYVIGEQVDMKQVRRWGWTFSPAGRCIVCADATEAVERFAHALVWDGAIHNDVRQALGGKDLACWCAPGAPCHADTLLMIANSEPETINEMHRAMDKPILEASATIVKASAN